MGRKGTNILLNLYYLMIFDHLSGDLQSLHLVLVKQERTDYTYSWES